MKPLFVAEVKTKSPFGFESDWDEFALLELAISAGDIVALHTEAPWGGSVSWLRQAARVVHRTGKLVLAKGIHRTDDSVRAALEAGADIVLVVGRRPHPMLEPVCWWEPSSFDQAIYARMSDRLVWNQRDLRSGGKRDGTIMDVMSFRPAGTWVCQASFISKPEHISPFASAFMVGEHLPGFCALAV